MLKWIIFASIAVVAIIMVIKVIKTMLKIEKQDKSDEQKPEPKVEEEYKPSDVPVDIGSSSAGIVTDMSNSDSYDKTGAEYQFDSSSGFSDHADEEFFDYSAHMRNRKGRRRRDLSNVDLDGEFADDFEYQPSNFEYLNPQRNKSVKKKPVSTELNELSTELKVLMLSDIFDRKFFD